VSHEVQPAEPAVSETPKRRWYQYSLKTLLVVLTLLCLGPGGYVAYEHAKARKQNAAVEVLEKLGGFVFVDTKVPCRSPMVRQVLGDDAFGNVAEVNLNYTQATDADLVHLNGLKGIRIVDLRNTKVTDAGLMHLAELKGLVVLDLGHTKVTDAGVAELQRELPKCRIYH
jgi:hypothetical protein